MEAAANRLAGLHLRAARTYLCLRFYFHWGRVALEAAGHLLHELAGKKRQGAGHLLETQNQHGGCILSQNVLKPSQGECSETQGAMEAAVVLEKNLALALLDLQALGSARTGPQL